MTWSIALQIAQVAVFPFIAWMWRQTQAPVKAKLSALGAEQARLAKEHAYLAAEHVKVATALNEKVSEDEWLREMMRLRNQVDRQSELLATMNGKMDSTLQVALSINRLAEVVGNKNQESHRAA